MIGRIWRGWTTRDGAAAYERLLCHEVIPAIEARTIAGFLHVDILRREVAGDEVEFTTIMVFDSLDAVHRFVGDSDADGAYVPQAARALLSRFDEHAAHHDILGRRCQPDHARGRD